MRELITKPLLVDDHRRREMGIDRERRMNRSEAPDTGGPGEIGSVAFVSCRSKAVYWVTSSVLLVPSYLSSSRIARSSHLHTDTLSYFRNRNEGTERDEAVGGRLATTTAKRWKCAVQAPRDR